MLCYVMLCYVMLCYVMLCYVMLCYVTLLNVVKCSVMFVTLCYVVLCSGTLCCFMLDCCNNVANAVSCDVARSPYGRLSQICITSKFTSAPKNSTAVSALTFTTTTSAL